MTAKRMFGILLAIVEGVGNRARGTADDGHQEDVADEPETARDGRARRHDDRATAHRRGRVAGRVIGRVLRRAVRRLRARRARRRPRRPAVRASTMDGTPDATAEQQHEETGDDGRAHVLPVGADPDLEGLGAAEHGPVEREYLGRHADVAVPTARTGTCSRTSWPGPIVTGSVVSATSRGSSGSSETRSVHRMVEVVDHLDGDLAPRADDVEVLGRHDRDGRLDPVDLLPPSRRRLCCDRPGRRARRPRSPLARPPPRGRRGWPGRGRLGEGPQVGDGAVDRRELVSGDRTPGSADSAGAVRATSESSAPMSVDTGPQRVQGVDPRDSSWARATDGSGAQSRGAVSRRWRPSAGRFGETIASSASIR